MNRQVYRMPKSGNIKKLKLQEEPLNEPGPEEVTVEVKAVGLNFADIFAMQGLYSATPEGSFIPGLEFSGIITKIGSEVTDRKVGQRVMGATKFGGYVSHITHHHRYVTPMPNEWSFEEGAGFLVQGLTAYYALIKLANLQKGNTVLIHSAAGGVGTLANRICRKYDAFTIGTVGSPRKVEHLKKEEDYNEIIVRDDNFEENLRKAVGDRELNIIMECIGGKILKQGWKVMAPMGRMISYGSASFTSHTSRPNYLKLLWKYYNRPKIDPLRLPSQNKSIMGFNLIWLYDRVDLMYEMLEGLQNLNLRPQYVGQTYEWSEMHAAIKQFQKGKTVGKVLVKTPN